MKRWGVRMFGRVYPDLQPSYTLYPELFEGLWGEAPAALRSVSGRFAHIYDNDCFVGGGAAPDTEPNKRMKEGINFAA